jgi:hypothetical protein
MKEQYMTFTYHVVTSYFKKNLSSREVILILIASHEFLLISARVIYS